MDDATPAGPGEASELERVLDAWFDSRVDEEPVMASGLGLTGHDHLLPDRSAGAYDRHARERRQWIAKLDAAPTDGVASDLLVDRDAVAAQLRGEEILDDWQDWRRDAGVYIEPGLQGVFTLFANRPSTEDELVAAVCARLVGVPGLLEQGRANLDADLAHPLLVRRAVGQARGGATWCRALGLEVAPGAARDRLGEAGGIAAKALEAFALHLEALAGRAHGSWRIGEQRYSALLRDRELLADDAASLSRRGTAAWSEMSAAMDGEAGAAARAAGIDPAGLEDGGPGRWGPVLSTLQADHAADFPALLRAYAAETAKARAFLAETHLVTLPKGEECLVEPAPPFRRAVLAVASYLAPPPLGSSRTGRFFIPFPPEGTPPDEIEQRLRTNSFAAIPTITAHEAYPGHHWHLSTALANPHRVRHLARTPYFSEGWGLFAERLMDEHGYFTDARWRLAHLDARLFRAARIVVDVALHTGEMNEEEAVEHLVRRANLSEATARAEVARYCSWPTQAAAYLTGALEIEAMRDRWVAGGNQLRDFCERVALTGSLPPRLAARALLAAA